MLVPCRQTGYVDTHTHTHTNMLITPIRLYTASQHFHMHGYIHVRVCVCVCVCVCVSMQAYPPESPSLAMGMGAAQQPPPPQARPMTAAPASSPGKVFWPGTAMAAPAAESSDSFNRNRPQSARDNVHMLIAQERQQVRGSIPTHPPTHLHAHTVAFEHPLPKHTQWWNASRKQGTVLRRVCVCVRACVCVTHRKSAWKRSSRKTRSVSACSVRLPSPSR